MNSDMKSLSFTSISMFTARHNTRQSLMSDKTLLILLQYRPQCRSSMGTSLSLTFVITIGVQCSFLRSQTVHNTHVCYALYTLHMLVTPPAPDVLSILFPAPFRSAQWGKSTWRSHSRCVIITGTRKEEEESPDLDTSRSRRRHFRATNMSFGEMLEMVDILKKADYDGKYGPYPNPNIRKAKIMAKVVKSLHRNFGVRRSKDQLRKRWSDLKLREPEQYRKIRRVLQKRDKRL
ncbi:hypothetical protein AB205_0165880 [Aquarana catesbeiana]|uniref:Uncharacterized protein n=1 Tax=Aquarana catesbeiana TaxID=8400 RepID=A0A2G9QEH2_AQUCT|nr:hypothetical protein AB205_0165880 [Aquarana catesbeiana]